MASIIDFTTAVSCFFFFFFVFILAIVITIAGYCTRQPPPANDTGGAATDSDHSTITVEPSTDEKDLCSNPKILYSKAKFYDSSSSNSCCSICLIDYQESDSLRVLPDCGHFFHVNGGILEEYSEDVLCIVEHSVQSKGEKRLEIVLSEAVRSNCYTGTPLVKYGIERSFSSDLLPLYRGTVPIQRALQDGNKETGVSLGITVHELDAGPIIASEVFQLDDQINMLVFLCHKESDFLNFFAMIL
ncbi:hypothetical protein L6164_005593 [Bauhinia variegata]|uniref:Uncharacterized protein n=1 Tax=Bauhinia variegata TaxID=167791 RepID=A0ACB9PX71_BAUVA|nr:hypothetical protein L6164_005593 [Bauhinia variegata]